MRHDLRRMTFGLGAFARSFILVTVAALTLIAFPVRAQNISVRPPTIVAFTASTPSVSLPAVERGEATITVVWRIADFDDILRVGLDQLVGGDWASILVEGETLSGDGTREVIVAHPGDFAPPTYRLSVINSSGELITQVILVVPYETNADAPSIESFTTDTPALDTAALLQRNALAVVRWSVANRRPTTNIQFEQLLSDQDVIAVEPPRESLWLPSTGETNLAPDVPLTEAVVRLRLSVIDLISGEVLDTAELTLPLSGAPLPIPAMTTPNAEATAQPTSAAVDATALPTGDAPTAQPTTDTNAATGAARIVVFSAQPTSARPGDSIIVSWNVENAVSVSVQEQAASGAAGLLYIELPPIGALSLRMPENSGGMTYSLRARGADGGEIVAEVTVSQGQ
ncbi:MAG: hypothetical protein SGI73_18765 [Chloroflexota bacterium]|nr:hypothetical protein [Chloroflexota bacterium]